MPTVRAIHARAASTLRSVALLLAAAAASDTLARDGAGESLVRVTCRGVHELVTAVATVECSEAGVLSGPAGLVVPHGTRARAALGRGRLEVEASGGSIRGSGSAPREASALLRTRIRFFEQERGEPGGHEVRIALQVRYAFTGYGAAGLEARLRTSTGAMPSEGARIRVRLEHRGFTGVRLQTVEQRGRVAGPAGGAYPSGAALTVLSVATLPEGESSLVLRGDLTAHSLGNLGSLEPVSSATVRASASVVLEVPCGMRAVADDGRPLVRTRERSASADRGEPAGAPCRTALRLVGDAR